MEPAESPVLKRKREEEQDPGPKEATDRGAENQDVEDETSAESSNDVAVFSSHSSSTHDTTASSFHFSIIHDFTRDLQAAVEASWKTRQDSSCSKYKAVRALLVSWEDDDLGVVAEIDVLGQLLEDVYRYDVRKWRIPSVDSFKALDGHIRSVTEDIWGATSSLFILYYAGHARPSRDLGSFPRWTSRRFKGKEVNPLSIQVYLENAECDVLFLYDCCHSIHTGGGDSSSGGVKEAMAAGGFETIAADVGEHSFTYLLTHQLARAAAQSQPISVSEIHGYLLAGLGNYTRRLVVDNCRKLVLDDNKRPRFEPPVRRTPVHYFLSQKHESIKFAPLGQDESSPGPPMMPPPPLQGPHPKASAASDAGSEESIELTREQFPQVLVSVRLQSSDVSDSEAWLDWLLKAPYDAKEIKVEGWFGSFSTLIILNIPLQVWHMMPDNPAVSFIGFVTTENLASDLLPNRHRTNIEKWQSKISAPYPFSVIGDSAVELDRQSVISHVRYESMVKKPIGPFRLETPSSFCELPPPDSVEGISLSRPNQKRVSCDFGQDHKLSCPFRKRNPVRFNVRDHQSCAVQSFPDISQLKRHVKNFHKTRSTSVFECPRCKIDLGTKAGLDNHLLLPNTMMCAPRESTLPSNPEDGITSTQEDILNGRKASWIIDTWEVLWTTLFPDDDKILDSVFVPPMELDEGIEMLRQRWSDLEDRILTAQQVHGSALEPDTVRDVFMSHLLSVREEFYESAKHG